MIAWKDEGARIVAMCGDAPIGAVFPSVGRRTRWRAWVTKNMNPVDGTERTLDEAQEAVRKKFCQFLALAKLQPMMETPADG